MNLGPYRQKRHLKKIQEPSGKSRQVHRTESLRRFVVQEHAARRLHYDLRLEIDGVLKSWAVPKGPSMNPEDKRLAVQVEDHPLEYATFEGKIPRGEYGAGDVRIWDNGTYVPLKVSDHEILFTLHGNILKGDFALIKLKDTKHWLLIKKKDAEADYAFRLEGREGMREITMGKRSNMPHRIVPMLATLIEEPFDHEEWVFEIKWDGYRAIAEVAKDHTLLYSRNFHSFNTRFPTIIQELNTLQQEMVIDGELVVLDNTGRGDFQLLQQYLSSGADEQHLKYYVFDLLYHEGRDLRELPLIQRKNLLREVLEAGSYRHLRYLDHIEAQGTAFFQAVKKEGIEGMIAKHKESHYDSKRSDEWLKIKIKLTEEAIIGGYTASRRSQTFGSLLLGMYRENEFVFIGHVGTGFNERDMKELFQKMNQRKIQECPFKEPPKTNTPATWIKPELVCQIEFQNWTQEGKLRQPVYKGLREDKDPQEVFREESLQNVHFTKNRTFLSNRDKIFWPKERYSKGDLLDYYERMAPYILPYLKDRPQVLHRFPDGIEGKSFYQKEAPEFVPDWMPTMSIEHSDKTVRYLLIQDFESLLYVVNLGCIELHPFLSTTESPEYPDYCVLDLDPQEITFKQVIKVSQILHEILDDIGVPHAAKTSGKKGMHIYIPLGKAYTYSQSEQFAELIARVVHASTPDLTSLERDPKKRRKKVYLDYLQNSWSKTVVAPYSVRPVPNALVSMPLTQDELENGSFKPSDFHIHNTLERLQNLGDDPFLSMTKMKADLIRAIERLEKK
ncbi:MAG: DNA ligase D [Chlamydiales bacterium]